MSTGGGWQDQVVGLAPGIKMVTSHAEVRQQISCMPCVVSKQTMKELDERFCLIYSGQRRLARNLLRDVVDDMWAAIQMQSRFCMKSSEVLF